MFWKRLSIATKLFLAFLLTSTLTILVITVLVGQTMRSGFSSYLLEVELQGFDLLASKISATYKDQDAWQQLSNSQRAWHDLVRTGVARPDGALQFQPRPDPRARQLDQKPQRRGENDRRRPPPPPRPDGTGTPPRPDPLQLGRRLTLLAADGSYLAGRPLEGRSYASRAIFEDEGEGRDVDDILESEDGAIIALLALSSPLDGRAIRDDQFLLDQFRALLLVSLLAIILSAIAAFLLARGVVTPIRDLVRGTRELTAGNYSARMEGEGPDELGMLVRDFNSLAASLQAAEKAERQWMSDASHELKTPLAILKGRIEGLQDGIYQADPKLLHEMHQTVEQLSGLVSDLNLLAHAREGRMLCSLSEENLPELVRDAVQHISGRYAEKGLLVDVEMPDTALVHCDRIRMRQMLDNLLENARRYTDAPGKVKISCSADVRADTIKLVIEDSPPRPQQNEIGRLFERFYRTDPSRTRQSGGSGLGLAICRAIAKAHNGTINARPSALGGLAIEIILPTKSSGQQTTR